MKNIKLKAVKVYQAVEFNRKLETYFVETSDRMKGLDLEVFENVGIVIRTENDQIIVPFTNVAFMKTELSHVDKKNPGREAKVGEGKAYRD
jgi:hypothetical protein